MVKKGILALILTANIIAPAGELTHTSEWKNNPDRIWIGAEYWAHPHQDWRIRDGRLECLKAVPEKEMGALDRNVHLLTIQPGRKSSFSMRVSLGRMRDAVKGWAGFRFGHHGGIDDYRHSCIRGQGINAGLRTNGELFLGDKVVTVPFPGEAVLELYVSAHDKDKHHVKLS